ncbi:MAG: hypothetical protein HC937_03610 [Aquincola sp.]|nr:hypothetical protein [Aquincola sp.]
MPTYAARIEASALLSPADVADASQALDAAVVEAWLVGRGEGLALSAKQLRMLRDAKVPGTTTDVLIALANPRVFQIAKNGAPGARPATRTGLSGVDCNVRPDLCMNGRRVASFPYGFADVFDPFFGMGYGYGGWGYNRFGMGYYGSCFNAFNCGNFGWGGNGFGWGNFGPVVIVPQPVLPQREQGRAINGSGYSQRGSSDGGSHGNTVVGVVERWQRGLGVQWRWI